MKHYSYEGYWIFELDPSNRINDCAGSLKIYKKGAAILELYLEIPAESPIPLECFALLNKAYAQTDSGIIEVEGLHLELQHKFPHRQPRRLSKIVFRVEQVRINHPCLEKAPQTFSTFILESKLLRYWCNSDSLYINSIGKFEIPEPVFQEFHVDSLNGRINVGYGFSIYSSFTSHKIKRFTSFSFEYSSPKDSKAVIRDADLVSRLITVLTTLKFTPKIKLLPYKDGVSLDHAYTKIHRWDGKSDKTIVDYEFNILIRFKDIESDLGQILDAWSSNEDTLLPIMEILESIYYREQIGLSTAFIKYSQIAETLHDRIYSEYVIKESEYRPLKRKIKNLYEGVVEGEIKENIDNAIEFAYKKTFRKKIQRLIDPEFFELFPHMPDINSLLSKITSTRNYYTHLQDGLRSKSASGDELLYITHFMEYLVRYSILKYIGVDKNKMIERLSEFYPLNHLNTDYSVKLRKAKFSKS